MKKGFTLIELLAVIVILAIIALIATPIVLNIINESKDSADMRSAEMYLSTAQLSIASKNLTQDMTSVTCVVNSEGNLKCIGECVITDGILKCGEEVAVNMSNNNIEKGKIVFEDGKIASVEGLKIRDKYYNTDNTGKLIISNSAPERLCGDANNNYVLDDEDPQALLEYVTYHIDNTPENDKYMDANGDGVVDAGDAAYIMRCLQYHGTKPNSIPKCILE